jgi:hypothetical protein
VKLPVSIRTAADARKCDCCQIRFIIRFIAEREDYTTKPKTAQENSGKDGNREARRAAREQKEGGREEPEEAGKGHIEGLVKFSPFKPARAGEQSGGAHVA